MSGSRTCSAPHAGHLLNLLCPSSSPQAEKAELEREFEEIKKQLEEDADREIEETKEKYEQK